MKFSTLIAIALIVYLVAEAAIFIYKYQNLPALTVPDQKDRIVGSGLFYRYIAAGDSTSVGEGASDFAHSYTGQVMQFLIQKNLDKSFLYKNVGVLGAKTGDVLSKQVDEIVAFRPNLVTISMGANDATHLVFTKTILNNYKAIINRLQNETQAQIYITDIPNFYGSSLLPWFYIQLLELRSGGLNAQIMRMENGRVHIVDIHNFGWYNYPDRSKTYAADGFHPNNAGYENWANAFIESIKNH